MQQVGQFVYFFKPASRMLALTDAKYVKMPKTGPIQDHITVCMGSSMKSDWLCSVFFFPIPGIRKLFYKETVRN